jgi:hypothetical protein
MSTPDATPSRDDDVAVPDYLYRILREAAERKLRDACDLAFSPDARDAVIEAVRCVEAFSDKPTAPSFTNPRLSLTVALALIPATIAWKEGEAKPTRTIKDVAHNGRLQIDIQDLVEFRDRLIGAAPQDDEQPDAEEVPR